MNTQFCTQCGTSLEAKARFCAACGTAVSSPDQLHSKRSKKNKKRSFPWTLVLLSVGLILIAIAVGYSLLPDSSPTIVEVPDEHDAAGLPYPEVSRISAAETKERLDNGTAVVVVDVRSSEDYAKSHITDALSLPLNEIQNRYQELAPDTEIITYCT